MSTKTKGVTILEALSNPQLLGKQFKNHLLLGDTWRPWKSYFAALFGLPLDDAAYDLYRECTGRTEAPLVPFAESFCIVGRRGGKTKMAAALACYLSALVDWSSVLSSGETGIGMLLARDRDQAKALFKYIVAMFEESPVLSRMVSAQLKDSIELVNNTAIEVHTSDYASVRGRTLIFAIADELAFWETSAAAASPDVEILRALRPALSTTNGLLIAISSPYAKKGALYSAYRDNFGRNDSPVLVWKAPTCTMNLKYPSLKVQLELLRDREYARAEYLAEFRQDIADFVSAEVVASCTVANRRELLATSSHHYTCFVDPSGGSGGDSFTAAIAHREGDLAVLDATREIVAPFSPENAVQEICRFLKPYRIGEVFGDHYAGDWPSSTFSRYGVTYRTSELTKSEIYLECLPLLNSQAVQLLDDERLHRQLCSLERRTSRSGRDSVDHPANSHDDLCNSVCGVLRLVAAEAGYGFTLLEMQATGQMTQALEEPSPTVSTSTEPVPGFGSSFSVAAQKFPPQLPPKPKVYEPCYRCGGDLRIVNEATRDAQCTKCSAQMQAHVRNPYAPTVGMNRGDFLQRQQRDASRFGRNRGSFGRFG